MSLWAESFYQSTKLLYTPNKATQDVNQAILNFHTP
jgi:hypothetical protein